MLLRIKEISKENWGLDDPSGENDDVFEKTIKRIEENIIHLKSRLM